jgi:hypothetical protein
MKPWLTAAAVVVVVALFAGGSILFFSAPTPGGGTTTTSTSGTSSTSVGAQNGLQLRLALNATALMPGAPPPGYKAGSRLGITVSEYNTRTTAKNVSAAQLWKINGLSLGACGTGAYPFGVAVFQGRLTSSNVSFAQPVRIYPAVPCPMLIRLVTGYLFEPTNDSAVILPSSNAVQTLMSANVTVMGNYSVASSLQALRPGVYTVAAGDEWGAVATLQFSVGGQTQTSTTTPGSGGLSLQLSIGPTAPVCRSNATTGPAPAPYSSISVVITPSSGHNMTFPVSWLSNGCEVSGSLQTSLAPGRYQLSLSSCTFMGCKSALPRGFTVVAGQSTSLSVSVDTGIR